MSTARPPFVAFYPTHFLGDTHVQAMTMAERGAYITLLCHAWQADPPATIPAADADIARLLGLPLDEWLAIRTRTLRPFRPEVIKHSPGGGDTTTGDRLVQKRLLKEFEAAARRIRQNHDRAAKSAQARWNNRNGSTSSSIANEVMMNAIEIKTKNSNTETPLPPAGGDETPACRPKRTRKRAGETAEQVPIPEGLDVPEFHQAWAEWLNDRRARNKVVTPTAARRQLTALAEHGPAEAVASINESIANGWTGLFPGRPRGGNVARPAKKVETAQEQADRIIAQLKAREKEQTHDRP